MEEQNRQKKEEELAKSPPMVSSQSPLTTPSPHEIPPQVHHPYPMPASTATEAAAAAAGGAGQNNWAAAMAVAAADFADPIHHLRFGDFPFPGGLAAFRKSLPSIKDIYC